MIGLPSEIKGQFTWINERNINYFKASYRNLKIWFCFPGDSVGLMQQFKTEKEMDDCVNRIRKKLETE